jgi:Protein of unknown function (DUF2892)
MRHPPRKKFRSTVHAMNRFRPNIDTRGRIARAIGALLLAAGAALTWPHSTPAGITLAVAAAFVAFEAARGWCAARACGVKTPL